MKKPAVMVFLCASISLLLMNLVVSQSVTPEEKIDNAYQCLEDEVAERQQSELSLSEAIFATLALGSQTKLIQRIETDKHNTQDCYGPNKVCTLLDTARVLLAYDRVHRTTEGTESWLLSRNITTADLNWFLQIDIVNHNSAQCTISWDTQSKEITINEDLTISDGNSPCFTPTASEFWLRIKQECFDETFSITCTEEFASSVLYQKADGGTIYVSPNTHAADALGTTQETINSKCFGLGTNSCNYEGTLWAALALGATGHDVAAFIPFLITLSEENQRLFPSAFLYMLTQGPDYLTDIVQSQKQSKYWEAPNTLYNTYHDSSLAMMALQGTPSTLELTNAQNYFLGIQTPQGCWNNNNIKDAAFLLFAGWPTTVQGNGNGGNEEPCEPTFYCVPSPQACTGPAQGIVQTNYYCPGITDVCCSEPYVLPSCALQNGDICNATEVCSASFAPASDTNRCCTTSACIPAPGQTACEQHNGTCASSCDPDFEKQDNRYACTPGKYCCVNNPGGSSSVWLWILVIILLLLIGLVVVAIIYREKLQLWWYRFKSNRKKGKSPLVPARPPAPQLRPQTALDTQMPQRRPMPPQRPQGTLSKEKTEKDLQETLRKLREMSE